MANSYLEHHLALLQHLRNILGALGEAEQVPEENHGLFIERFDELMDELPRDPEGAQYLGQDLISQVFHRYPQIAHLVPRDLLWFFGGDCLHFMPDEEIDLFQPHALEALVELGLQVFPGVVETALTSFLVLRD